MKQKNCQTNELNYLLSRLQEGDVKAFGIIYGLFYNKLLRYGNIILSDNKVVEDAIQDLFVWILQNPQSIQKVNNFEVYLFQSLKKNLIAHIKTNGRHKTILHHLFYKKEAILFQHSIEHKLIQEESLAYNKNWVKQKIDNLPARQKEILFLRYYEGLSYDEIAEITSLSNQIIRNYVARALKQIRKLGKLDKILFFIFCFLFA